MIIYILFAILPHPRPSTWTLTVNSLLGVTRELLKQTRVNLCEFRAAQLTNNLSEKAGKSVDRAKEDVRFGLSGKLVDEAAEIVALEEIGRVEDTAGEVSDIYADERVGRASVTAMKVSGRSLVGREERKRTRQCQGTWGAAQQR